MESLLEVRFFRTEAGNEPVRDWLKEIRVNLDKRIARILFTVVNNCIVLLHGFIKKSQVTPAEDLKLARQRLKQTRSNS